MRSTTLLTRYILLSLNSLLVFLSFFSDKLKLPAPLLFAGKLHPLILHLPIGILLITVVIYLFRQKFEHHPGELISWLFHLGAVTAALAAISGLFLSKSGTYDEHLLFNHQWSGVAISIIAAILSWSYTPGKQVTAISLGIILLLPVLLAGGHYGASLTHGEEYLSYSMDEKKIQKIITDSSSVFDAVVEPVLEAKCYSCHNEKKAKGELVLTSISSIMEGGKHGHILVAGDPLNSHIIQRVVLEEDNKKHMPPKGKPQLTESEIALLHAWIKNGASTTITFASLAPTDSFRILASSLVHPQKTSKIYSFAAARPSQILLLQSPYLTVQPIANGSPALRADFFIRDGFDVGRLATLEKISDQLVELNLSNMPVKDEDLNIITRFKNLEYLSLNGSMITGKNFHLLRNCKKLNTISVAGTAVKKAQLVDLAEMKNVSKIFCWNTATEIKEIAELQKRYADISWNYGYIPDTTEHLQLTPPQLKNDELRVMGRNDSVFFKHPMPGVTIRYTKDGSTPDSLTSAVYSKGIAIDNATQLKAIAVKNGWMASGVSDFSFFAKGYAPFMCRLLVPPDKQYMANGVETLIDGKKGETSNLRADWLGYREGYFDAKFYFSDAISVREVVVSAAKNIGAFVMPPQRIEIWAGQDSARLKLVSTVFPKQPAAYEPDAIQAHKASINGPFRYFRIIAYPIKILPKWHSGKGQKAWFFLDEIFFN